MAVLLPNGKQSFSDNAGNPLVGGKLYTYQAGTSTPKQTWSDAAGTVPNANPVVLDARGEATIFWLGTYKVSLHDALDNLIWTIDGIVAATIDQTLRSDLASTDALTPGSSLIGLKSGQTLKQFFDAPNFPSLTIGTAALGGVLTYNDPSLDYRPNKAKRGEIRVCPNDVDGAPDDAAGGELTILAYDTAIVAGANQSFMALYARRVAGTFTAFRIRSLGAGTGLQAPIEIDATGGITNTLFRTDGGQQNAFQLQVGGIFPDQGPVPVNVAATPSVRIGPFPAPSLDLDDSGTLAGAVISTITFAGTTATLTTATPHGLATGNLVTVRGALPIAYSVTLAAITVTGASTFTFVMGSVPATNATTLGAFAYGGTNYRFQSNGGNIRLVNVTRGTVGFQQSPLGWTFLPGLNTIALAGHTPNLYYDPADGQLYRTI